MVKKDDPPKNGIRIFNSVRSFRKYFFPGLYGLMVYFTIRLLHDIEHRFDFWKRAWSLNTLEISLSILVGYIGIDLFRRLLRHFDKREADGAFGYARVGRELVTLVGINLVLVNAIFTPMAALTDDGLSLADFVDINVIPSLFAVMYYGMARSSQFLKAYVDNRVQLEKVTNEQLQSELQFLKAQYHPHFLFNALNTIYFQMDEDLSGAKGTLEKLSELLRYQLYDQQHPVPIRQEINHLNSFVELQRIRISAPLVLNVDIDPRLEEQQVYPLLFLPLIENAFKYAGGDYVLHIKLHLQEDNSLMLKVSNSMPSSITVKENAHGIGLGNLQRRLQLLYPGKHRFEAGRHDNQFIAELQLEM